MQKKILISCLLLLSFKLFAVDLRPYPYEYKRAPFKYEISLLGGFNFGGSFDPLPVDPTNPSETTLTTDDGTSFGTIIGFTANHSSSAIMNYELYFSNNNKSLNYLDTPADGSTQTNAQIGFSSQYYHLGGSYRWRNNGFDPYIALSAGVSRFVANSFGTETGFSVGFGAGFNWMLTDKIAIKGDLRNIISQTDPNSGILCHSSAGCFGNFSGSSWMETVGLLGASFTF